MPCERYWIPIYMTTKASWIKVHAAGWPFSLPQRAYPLRSVTAGARQCFFCDPPASLRSGFFKDPPTLRSNVRFLYWATSGKKDNPITLDRNLIIRNLKRDSTELLVVRQAPLPSQAITMCFKRDSIVYFSLSYLQNRLNRKKKHFFYLIIKFNQLK